MLPTRVYVIRPEAASSRSLLSFSRRHIDLLRVRSSLCRG